MRDTTLTSPEMYMERVATCFYMKYHVYWENITDPRSFIYFIIIYFIIIIIIIIVIIILFYFIIIIIIIILFYWSFIFLSLKHVYDLNCTFFSPINLWQRLVWSSDLGNLKPKQNIRVNLSSLANGLSKKIDEISGWTYLYKHHSRIQSFIHFKTATSIPCIRSSVHPCR